MAFYSIHYLEQLTGIKAHTMRIWEQRYSLINPGRTETKIRYYNDDHLKKLLNISTLLQAGYRIGDLSLLSDEELHRKIDALHKEAMGELPNVADIHAFIGAAMTYDEDAFNAAYDRAFKRLGIELLYTQVIYPMMVRIGTLWNVNKVNPAQEHFISNLLRQKLFVSINALKPPTRETWVLFLPEYEMHEIGLLFANFMLRLKGYKTIYLGQNVPYDTLKSVMLNTRANGLLYFQVKQTPKATTISLINKLDAEFASARKILCSSPAILKGLKPSHENFIFLNSPDQFIEQFKHSAWEKQL